MAISSDDKQCLVRVIRLIAAHCGEDPAHKPGAARQSLHVVLAMSLLDEATGGSRAKLLRLVTELSAGEELTPITRDDLERPQ